MQRICSTQECNKRPSYGYEWKKPTHCSKHAYEGMENVVDRRCQKRDCKKVPIYSYEGKPTHCYEHKLENMINTKSKRCAEKECNRIPTYGFEKNKPIYCARHAKKEMIDCRSNTCEQEDCTTVPSFGYTKPTHCKDHRKEDMKYLKHNSKQDLPETAKSCKFKNETASKNNLDIVKTSMPGTATYSVRYERSFASFEDTVPGTDLKKVDCWDTERNDGVMPKDVSKCTHSKYWFNCPICEHSFESSLGHITSKTEPKWCPYCANHKLCDYEECSYCYNNSFVSYDSVVPGTEIKKVDCWDTESNDGVMPKDVFKCARKKYWFKCPTCEHSFESTLYSITSKTAPTWCPYCSNQKLCENKDCSYCYNNSFASYEEVVPGTEIKKVDCWDTERNRITPRYIFKSANKKYWFKCPTCEHSFESFLNNITKSKNQTWCPHCGDKKLCENKDCSYCRNKSFASYEEVVPGTEIKKVDCWDTERNIIFPRDVFKSANKKYWFKCSICEHSFESTLSHITNSKNPTWCPYCCFGQKICEDKDCSHCYNNSFASYDGLVPGTEIKKVDCWDIKKNNGITPRYVTKSSGKKYWFNCHTCELSFESSLGHITSKTEPRWCPHCRRKTERKLYKFLINLYGQNKIKKEKNFEWLKSKRKFDFFISFKKIIVELDGNQHFFEVKTWGSNPEEQQENDNNKTKLALENDYTVIRLYQPDVLFDKNNWEEKFSIALEDNYPEPIQVCIGPEGLYKHHL